VNDEKFVQYGLMIAVHIEQYKFNVFLPNFIYKTSLHLVDNIAVYYFV